MIGNFGNLCLYAACVASICAVFSGRINLEMRRIVFVQFCLLTMALLRLSSAYINTDFSFSNVVQNSHEFMPALYKVTGLWANHDGSMLLWVWMISLINLLFATRNKLKFESSNKILQIQSVVLGLFLGFTIFASNPFIISKELFPQGRGFNPLLQDMALSIHPPILYAGYAGLSIAFSASLTALLHNHHNALWFKNLRIWIMSSWALLTLGIGLGGWWAYRELGWGGFWFWDPVENISLIVWLITTALLHKNSIALGIVSFLVVVAGIFLVRAGLLSSVHSFAFDQSKASFLLLIFGALATFSLYAYLKSPLVKSKSSGDIAVKLNIFYLLCIASIIALGIAYPFLTKNSISIKESFYENTLSFVFIPLLVTASVHAASNLRRLSLAATLAALICSVLYSFVHDLLPRIYLAISTCLAISLLLPRDRPKLLKNFVAMTLGHLGLALLVFSASLYYGLQTSQDIVMQKGDSIMISKYNLTLSEISYGTKDNYMFREAKLNMSSKYSLAPQIRFYPIEKTFTYESGILHTLVGDIYATIGALDDQNKLRVHIQYKPFIYLIWFSIILMCSSAVLYYKKLVV